MLPELERVSGGAELEEGSWVDHCLLLVVEGRGFNKTAVIYFCGVYKEILSLGHTRVAILILEGYEGRIEASHAS